MDENDCHVLSSMLKVLPTDDEIDLFNVISDENKIYSKEDLFIYELVKSKMIRPLESLKCLIYMADFEEEITRYEDSIDSIVVACNDILKSEFVVLFWSVYLLLANYMMSSKPGGGIIPCLKVESIESLPNTISPKNKSIALIHYIVHFFEENYPHLLANQLNDLNLNVASEFSIDSLKSDVSELDRGFKSLIDEMELRKQEEREYSKLSLFLKENEIRLNSVLANIKHAKDTYTILLSYFCEDSSVKNTEFFGYWLRFSNSVKDAKAKNKKLVYTQDDVAAIPLENKYDNSNEFIVQNEDVSIIAPTKNLSTA
ncbi:MAG: Formin-like protein 2 [Paramarteilia canceri]